MTKPFRSGLSNLQPAGVWAHFATLCAIPRPSLHESALRAHLVDWAHAHGIGHEIDAAGNLILRKPGSPGCEDRPSIVLQGHLDMVCQANSDTQHDFRHDPIRAVVHDGWIVAEDTTLGADNGVGVALALAMLEESGLKHPPIEVLLTVNEESGMDGARGLAPDSLKGRRLINLDTEEWGHFYLGCAGGVDVEVHRRFDLGPVPEGFVARRIDIGGLRGGHSGIDIHLGHGNAIKLMAETLLEVTALFDIRLAEMHGGTARNAIPREAGAVIALPAEQSVALEARIGQIAEALQQRFAISDPALELTCRHNDSVPDMTLVETDRDRLLVYLVSTQNGVDAMSADFPGVVETSDNLGVLALAGGQLGITFKVRSLDGAKADALADSIVDHAHGHGLEARKEGAYPGWMPSPDSPLLSLCQRVYTEQFGQPASEQVIHAGLECGLFSASYPDLDMISFGPDIRGAHAPGERVEIASVEKCWRLLKAVMQALASD
jgi:dipeptidase D